MGRGRDKFGEDLIDRIEVTLTTGSEDDAGTDGQVYLIIAGREFNLNRRNHNDREVAATDTYVLGRGANIEHAAMNSPQGMPIRMVWNNPIGLRFEPVATPNPPDRWMMSDAYLSVFTEGGYEDTATVDVSLAPSWLGFHFGLVVGGFNLEIQDEDKAPLKTKRSG